MSARMLATRKGLLVRKPWVDLILDASKTWELRGLRTKTRGPIALIESGTGTIVGTCELVDVLGPLTLTLLKHRGHRHRHPSPEDLGYANIYAWVLRNARRLPRPVPYVHPQGAVIWVNLAADVVTAIGTEGGEP